jgi:hypothetical protein
LPTIIQGQLSSKRIFHQQELHGHWTVDCVALSQLDMPFLSSVLDSWPVMMIGQLESSVGSSGLDS